MSKLYAVTAGGYSDYHIITLCSDKFRAEQIRDTYNMGRSYAGFGDASVSEYEDGIRADIDSPLFEVVMTLSGDIDCVSEINGDRKIAVLFDNYKGYTGVTQGYTSHIGVCYYAYVSTDNKEKASKIARDRLAEFKAKRGGIS